MLIAQSLENNITFSIKHLPPTEGISRYRAEISQYLRLCWDFSGHFLDPPFMHRDFKH